MNGTATTLTTGEELDELTWYSGTVRMQWNDEKTPTSSVYTRDGAGYTCAGSISHGGAAPSSNRIVFRMPAAPICISITVGLSTDNTDPDGGCAACSDRAGGGTAKYRDGLYPGGGSTKMWESGCSVAISNSYNWIASGTDTAYKLSNAVVNNSNTVNCNTECGL